MVMTIKDKYIERIFKFLILVYGTCIIGQDIMLNTLKFFGVYSEITTIKCIQYFILTLLEAIIIFYFYFKYKDNFQKLKENYTIIKVVFFILTFFNYIIINITFSTTQFISCMPFSIMLTLLFLDKKLFNISWCTGFVIELGMIFYKLQSNCVNEIFKCELILRLIIMVLVLGAVYIVGFIAIYCIDHAEENQIEILSHVGIRDENLLKIKESSCTINESSGYLAKASEESALSMQEIMEQCNFLNEKSKEIVNTLNLNENTLDEVVKYSKYMNSSANIAKESSENILINAEKDKVSMENLHKLVCTIRDDIYKTLNATEELQQKSEQMDTIVNIISSISDQTNLLSLNASIEAVRVGEAGKGFIVVAEQIRKLAEQSSNSVSNIVNIIKEYKNKVIQVENFMNNNNKTIQESKTLIENSLLDLKDTLLDLKHTSEKINVVVDNTQIVTNKIQDVSDKSYNIHENITNMSSKFEKIKIAVEDNTAISEEISASTEELSSIAENLNNIVQN